MRRKGKIFAEVIRQSAGGLMTVLAATLCCAVVFLVYGLSFEPFIYAAILTVFSIAVIIAVKYYKELSEAEKREKLINSVLTEPISPIDGGLADKDYSDAICLLQSELVRVKNEYESKRKDELDYYTAWVHQIKTPIAVMRMELGDSSAENSQSLETELFRIEQYADMALQYIRLGSDTTDLLIKEYPLDGLIRESVRKFAPQFVAKRLSLCYDGTDKSIVTDKKWFFCILEQLISNAVKYTQSGGITISVEEGCLRISDDGIGIAAEDIPRIFEKGFTGENGRYEKRSSGLGLYICRKAAELLRIPLSVESAVGKGSIFTLELDGKLK